MNYLKSAIDNLFKDAEIKKFILENKLTDDDIINNLSTLTTQQENNLICKKNPKGYLDDPFGMASRIEYSGGVVDLIYYEVEDTGAKNNLETLFFPTFPDIANHKLYNSINRSEVLNEVLRFQKTYKPNKFIKGVFIHGKFGTGKTFLMQRLAYRLSEKGHKVLIAYYPDLVRQIKSSIADGAVETYINKLKHADVLILDDIGAESNTNFIRDEVLGPILQFRIDMELPVCMTSNLSFDELKLHFQESSTGKNVINSERIISRIRYLMTPVNLDDIDYRANKK